jgi:REP element-mobilizing transposase RayT
MLPRPVLPQQFYLITRRCTQRQFLLRPDPETNNAFIYCLIDAALRYDVEVLLPCAMSNHYLCAAGHNRC